MLKDVTLVVFCWKDLVLLYQISLPSQARLKFPTPWAWMTVKYQWVAGEGGGDVASS